ncbi:hypothetical protein F5Y16DRAFT_225524 [Xylariaceae sp. FL0255]|nr:hypothetical protein F5Y16DRAFT_225524 [Xylariaceae sp. FL0255]
MPGLIGTLAVILPLAAAMPRDLYTRSSNHTSCTAISSSKNFKWNIVDFVYHGSYVFSTPAHQIDSGTVNFNLSNPATDENISCSAYSDQLEDFFYGTYNYNCTTPTGSTTITSFNYSTPSTVLNVNQTWECTDVKCSKPKSFTALGSIDLNLSCTDTYYQNPNWTEGEIYSTRTIDCNPVTIPLTPFKKE